MSNGIKLIKDLKIGDRVMINKAICVVDGEATDFRGTRKTLHKEGSRMAGYLSLSIHSAAHEDLMARVEAA